MNTLKSYPQYPYTYKYLVEELMESISIKDNNLLGYNQLHSKSLPKIHTAVIYFLEYDDAELAKCTKNAIFNINEPYSLEDHDYILNITYDSATDVFIFTLNHSDNLSPYDVKTVTYSALDLLDSLEVEEGIDWKTDEFVLMKPFCQLLRRLGYWGI